MGLPEMLIQILEAVIFLDVNALIHRRVAPQGILLKSKLIEKQWPIKKVCGIPKLKYSIELWLCVPR